MYSQKQYPAQQYQVNKRISQAQLDTIIEAILAGKYSYACMMTLEATGHDPLDYIPYRTYNRLQKQRQARGRSIDNSTSKVSPIKRELSDLDYIESACKESANLNGGQAYGGQAHQGENHNQDNRPALNNLIFWPNQPSLR